MKKLLILALAGALTGCAAAAEVQSQMATGIPTMFVKSVSVNSFGSDKYYNIVIWANMSSSAGALTALSRADGIGSASHSLTPAPVLTGNSYTDTTDLNADTMYVYQADFPGGRSLTRQIQPLRTNQAGLMTATEPVSTNPLLPTAASSTRPHFSWRVDSDVKPTGFLLSVGEAPSGSSAAASLSATPVYTAFLDYAKHVDGVDFGAATDIQGLTGDLLGALGKMDARFAQKDVAADVTLVSGKTYMWVVSPLKFDDNAVHMVIGGQSIGLFKAP